MIVWQGRGGITALIIFLSIGVVLLLHEWTGHRVPDWVTYVAMAVIAGGANAFFAAKYAQPERRILIDKQTGQEIELVRKHTLFWIPVWYWTYIILAYAVIGTVMEWTK